MNLNYYQQNPRKLHSPLLDGNSQQNLLKESDRNLEIKKNSFKEKNIINNALSVKSEDNININLISFIENLFTIGNIFVFSIGGLISVLELVNLISIIYSGNNNYVTSLMCFGLAFIGTIISMMICLSIVQIIRAIKYVYLNIDDQNSKLTYILKKLSGN